LEIVCRRREETSWLLQVRNSGGAAPEPPPAPGQGSSFGLELVRLLTEQLNGTVHIDRSPDFCVSLVFPLPEPAERPTEES
jgi:two-component sensor histidine kinase